jgi:signal transduction histidine kinase
VKESGEPFPAEELPSTLALRTGRPVHDVVMGVFSPAAGEQRWIAVYAVPRLDAAGAACCVFTSFTDVTERKRMLERLFAAERMASMGALAAGVAHDVNSPLTSVLSNLRFAVQQLGEAGGPGAGPEQPLREALPEVLEALGEARDAAERVGAIARELRAFSLGDGVRRPGGA